MRSLRLLLLALVALAATPARSSHAQEAICFAEVPQCLSGPLRDAWQERGGLAVFGLPLSTARDELIEGAPALVQWFERARLELPTGATEPAQVRSGRVGAELLVAQGRPWRVAQGNPAPVLAGCRQFLATGHRVCGPILAAWQGVAPDEAGRLALLGLPLTPPRTETLADGRPHTVQWFERARIELHPTLPAPFDV